ncbi:MAG: glycosyltransferase family 4 protein [Flavobacteriales bacterium]|nr:glycosyltransferase family 4 protein [Flavobacteriales bacterium]
MALRVAYITHYPELYGANRSMLDLLLELRQRGEVEPTVLLPRPGALTGVLDAAGVPWRIEPFKPWMSERHYSGRIHHRIGQYFRQERAVSARARENETLLPGIAQHLRDAGTEVIHANSSVVGIAPQLAKALGVPLVWHIRELPERQYLLHLDAGRRRYGAALRGADRLIAISDAVRQDIVRYTGTGSNITLIRNGVLHQARYAEVRAQCAERWTRTAPFTFVLVGLIHPSKGQVEAVEALALVRSERPEARLLIAGEGRDEELRSTIVRTGQEEAVELAGFVQDPHTIFARGHALLMCSRNEAMGRVTVEAMATGMPVIGHASGGTVELVHEGINGSLYPGGAAPLAERMLRMMEDPAKTKALGESASVLAEERFSIERYASRVLEVYRAVHSSKVK